LSWLETLLKVPDPALAFQPNGEPSLMPTLAPQWHGHSFKTWPRRTNMSFRVKLAVLVALALFGIAHATGAFMLSGTAATSVMHAGD
jgi:hypothetical protein